MVIAERGDGCILREGRADDLPAVDAIAIAAWTPIHEHMRALLGDAIYEARRDPLVSWQEQKTSQVRAHFQRWPKWLWVVERGGEVIAFITFCPNRDTLTGSIGNNAVRPDCQGQGLATFMYRHVLGHFRREGMRFATVRTGLDPGHSPACRAYEACGFDHQVPQVDYWQDLSALNPGSCPPAEQAERR